MLHSSGISTAGPCFVFALHWRPKPPFNLWLAAHWICHSKCCDVSGWACNVHTDLFYNLMYAWTLMRYIPRFIPITTYFIKLAKYQLTLYQYQLDPISTWTLELDSNLIILWHSTYLDLLDSLGCAWMADDKLIYQLTYYNSMHGIRAKQDGIVHGNPPPIPLPLQYRSKTNLSVIYSISFIVFLI